jgi:diacylglycerol kinase (ATP)
MSEKVTVIVNPASGRGRGAKTAEHIHRAFADVGVTDIRFTTSPGQERDIAAQALREGATTIVACGGDGTWSNVANALVAAKSTCRLAIVAAGTGNDFAKSLKIPATDVEQMARLAVHGPDTLIDVGKIEDKYFLNITGFGFDIAVLEDIESIWWLRGYLLYKYSALKQLLSYKGLMVDITSPTKPRGMKQHLMVIVANAKYFGGTFVIAPNADLADGKLDLIAIHDASPIQRANLFGAVGKGTHMTHSSVDAEQSASFTLRFTEAPAYETDGEYNRAKSAVLEITTVPRALRLVVPPKGNAPA